MSENAMTERREDIALELAEKLWEFDRSERWHTKRPKQDWLDAVAALLRPHVWPRESFWVVERFENGRSEGYWDGASSRSFQFDIGKAIQFRRKEDAFWATRGWHWKDVELTEHLMMAALPSAPLSLEGSEPAGETKRLVTMNSQTGDGV